jgi:hypothetical protein
MVEPQSCLSVAPTNPTTPFADGGAVGTDPPRGAAPCLSVGEPRRRSRTTTREVPTPMACLTARPPQPEPGGGAMTPRSDGSLSSVRGWKNAVDQRKPDDEDDES